MTEEKLAHLFQESRLVSASENVLYPLIKLKIEQRISLACARFVGGETQFIADIAYIQGLKEIEIQLKKIQTAGNQANYDLHKEQIK